MVNMVKGDVTTAVAPEDVAAYKAQGFHPEGEGEELARTQAGIDKQTYGGARGAIAAGMAGAARGISAGASDAGIAALGGAETLRGLEAENPTISTVTNIAGAVGGTLLGNESALPTALIGRAGRAVAELGEGAGALRAIGGAAAGGAVEGGLYGAGNAVSQLAMSSDPIDAEHMASAFSSNMLLGAGLGGITGGVFKAGERALARASTALTDVAGARGALAGVPDDLAGLDDAGLREAGATAAAERKAQVTAEKQSLEGLRVEQRAELANQVKDFHDVLAEEHPLYQAVSGPEVEAIDGVKDIKVQLAKSFKTMRAQFDNPIGIARDPDALIRPLEMRQTALESLQTKVPEIEAKLADDAASARIGGVGERIGVPPANTRPGLDFVDEALATTRKQIADIRAVSKTTPVAGGRLTELENSLSPRQQAIEAARDALKNAPEAGIIQKSAQAAAFGGVTAVAHAIPGVGVAAPFMGASASKIVGRLFEHMAGAKAAIAGKTAETASTFLDAARKVVPVAPMVATKILGSVRFAPPQGKEEPKDLPGLFAARSAEIRSQTTIAPDGSIQMRPDARAALSMRLDPIAAVNPRLADGIETVKARGISYISSKIPREPDIGGIQIGPSKWQPSDLDMRSWARVVSAVEDPAGVEERLVHGTLTPEDAEAYRTVYPQRFAQLQSTLMAAAPTLTKSLPYARQLTWSIFAGIAVTASMEPNIRQVLQASFTRRPPDSTASIPGMSPPKIEPSFGSLGSVKKSIEQPTPSQQRGAQHP